MQKQGRLFQRKPQNYNEHYHKLNHRLLDKGASNRWLLNGELFLENEFLLGIQNQVISTNNCKKIKMNEKSFTTDKCRKCHKKTKLYGS